MNEDKRKKAKGKKAERSCFLFLFAFCLFPFVFVRRPPRRRGFLQPALPCPTITKNRWMEVSN
jgi:hypothetical protein